MTEPASAGTEENRGHGTACSRAGPRRMQRSRVLRASAELLRGAHVRNRTGAVRLRSGCSTIEQTWACCGRLVATRAAAEGIEPSSHRLTVGCLTIRLRCNVKGSPASACETCADEPRKCDARLSENEGALAGARRGTGHRGRTCVAGFRDQCPAIGRARCCSGRRALAPVSEAHVSRRATCRDRSRTSRSRSGGTRTLTISIKSRVRLPFAPRTRGVGREGVEPSSLGVKARCSAD